MRMSRCLPQPTAIGPLTVHEGRTRLRGMLAWCFAALLLCTGSARASSPLGNKQSLATNPGALPGQSTKIAPGVAEAKPENVVVSTDSISGRLHAAVSMYCRVPHSREEYAKIITNLHKAHSRLFYDPIYNDKSPYDLLLECNFNLKALIADMRVRYPVKSDFGTLRMSITAMVPRIWHTGPVITAAANLSVDVANTKAMLTQEDFRYGTVAGKHVNLMLQPFLSVMYLVTLYKTDIEKFKRYILLANANTRQFTLAILSLYNPHHRAFTPDAWTLLGISLGLQPIAEKSLVVPLYDFISSFIRNKLTGNQNIFGVLCSTIVTTVQEDTSNGAVVTKVISPLMDYLTMLGNNGEYNMGGFLLHYLATNQSTFNRLTSDKQLALVRLALHAYPFVKPNATLLEEKSDLLFEFLHSFLYNARLMTPNQLALEVQEPKTAVHDLTYLRFVRQSQWIFSGYCRREYQKCVYSETPVLYNLSMSMQLCVARSLQSEAGVVFDEAGLHIPCECMHAAAEKGAQLSFYDFVKYNAYQCLERPEYEAYDVVDANKINRAELSKAVAFYLDLWYKNRQHMSQPVEMSLFLEHVTQTGGAVVQQFWEPSSDSTPADDVPAESKGSRTHRDVETFISAISERGDQSLSRMGISKVVTEYYVFQSAMQISTSDEKDGDGSNDKVAGKTSTTPSILSTPSETELESKPLEREVQPEDKSNDSPRQDVSDPRQAGSVQMNSFETIEHESQPSDAKDTDSNNKCNAKETRPPEKVEEADEDKGHLQKPPTPYMENENSKAHLFDKSEPAASTLGNPTLDDQAETNSNNSDGGAAEEDPKGIHVRLVKDSMPTVVRARLQDNAGFTLSDSDEEEAGRQAPGGVQSRAARAGVYTESQVKELVQRLMTVKGSSYSFPPHRRGSMPIVGARYVPDGERIWKCETGETTKEHGNSSERATVAPYDISDDLSVSDGETATGSSGRGTDDDNAPRPWLLDERGIPLHAKVIYWLVAGGLQLGVALWVWLYVRGAARAEAEGAERSAALRNPRARQTAAAPPGLESYRV